MLGALVWALATHCAVSAADGRPGSDQDCSWRQFRGPQRNGISPSSGLLQLWPTGGPPLLWTSDDCGTGYAGVVVFDGKVLTAGSHARGTEVVALSLDGTRLWTALNGTGRWRVPKDKTDWATPFGGTRSTPTIADSRVLHLDVLGRLAAFELDTGKELWALELADAFNGVCNEWGYSESVLVHDGRLYCLPGGEQAFLVCLDAATGKTVWTCNEIPDTKASNASAIVAEIDGVRQIVTMTTVLVVGVRAEDGELLWHVRHANRFRENCEIPQYGDGVLYVSSGYRHGSEGYRIGLVEDGRWMAEQIWRTNHADNLHGGPIILNGFVYAAGYDHRGAFCLDLRSGEFKWRHKPIGRSSYTFADGLLYRLGEDGTLALERPCREGHEAVSAFRIPSAGGTKCLTHPVVCGTRLYVRHQQHLYCYDIAAPQVRKDRQNQKSGSQ